MSESQHQYIYPWENPDSISVGSAVFAELSSPVCPIHTQTTLHVTYVAVGCICALHAADAA